MVGGAHSVQERQKSLVQVARTPGRQGSVQGDHQGRDPGGPRSAEKTPGDLRVLRPVRLEPVLRVAHRPRDLLHRRAGGGGEHERHTLRGSCPRGGRFGVRVHQRQHPDRRRRRRRSGCCRAPPPTGHARARPAACAARSGGGPEPPGWRARYCRRPCCPPHDRPAPPEPPLGRLPSRVRSVGSRGTAPVIPFRWISYGKSARCPAMRRPRPSSSSRMNHEQKASRNGPPGTEAECFRPIAKQWESGHLATSCKHHPCGYRAHAHAFRDFAPLIQYAMLLKAARSMCVSAADSADSRSPVRHHRARAGDSSKRAEGCTQCGTPRAGPPPSA